MKKGVNLHLYLILAVVNIVVFFLLWHGAGTDGLDNYRLLDWGANFAPLTLTGEPWRLLTSAFLHGSWTHLLLNMYMLFVLGSVLERVVGSARFGAIYLLSALGGSLLSAFWHGYHEVNSFQYALGTVMPTGGIRPVVSVGASGALMGLAGAAGFWAMFQPGNAKDEAVERVSGSAIAQVLVINLVYGFITTGIDQAAHIGGVITGFVAAAVLFPWRSIAPRMSAFVLPVLLAVVGSAAMVGAALHGQSEDLRDWKSATSDERAKAKEKAAALAESKAVADAIKEDARTAPKPVTADEAAGTVIKLGNWPDHMAPGASGKYLYVTDNADNTISVVDLAQHAVTRTIQGGAFPTTKDGCPSNYCRGRGATGIAVSPDERYAYVASMREDSLVRVDLQSGAVVDAVKLGRFPRDVVASSNFDRLYVFNGVDDTVSVVSVAQWPKVLATIALSKSGDLGAQAFGRSLTMWLSADDSRLFTNSATKNALLEFDTKTFRQVHEYPMDEGFDRALKTPNGVWLYGGALKWADATTLDVRKSYEICATSTRMLGASGDGRFVAVADPYGNTMQVVKVATRQNVGAYPIQSGYADVVFSKDDATLYALSGSTQAQSNGSLAILSRAKTMDVSSDAGQDAFLCPASAPGDAPSASDE
ncbi:MAG TPA: rhomboid family intramembrane serine protease [Paraburkholderia sp.]|jgi:YVTN family beta-propeller protein|uniref:rhomboid family intramembrane serine protease n=1 Tax=Paraburkholderia sp. TaxID=1926495 RepID=UPI002DF619FB|nr:rhomboid family intramembrane serine protease [Paraburkholderia sp.]